MKWDYVLIISLLIISIIFTNTFEVSTNGRLTGSIVSGILLIFTGAYIGLNERDSPKSGSGKK